ncbi:hypothetical protein RLIN73S_06280 [Rhodanobacter lindaniclasticus]
MARFTGQLPSQPRNPDGAVPVHRECANIGSTGRVQQGETLVPDMIVHHIDGLLAERIAALAKLRQCSVNDVMLDALRSGLGMSVAQQYSESLRNPNALTVLDGHWEAAERGAFQEALQALARTRPTQLAPESIRYDEPGAGAE